jgi:hypothetical protein
MSKPTQITDHADRVKENLPSEFHGSPRLVELVQLFAAEIQSLENLFHDLIDDRQLDTAIGAQLDVYGKHVNWHRLGFSDADYRKLIKVAIVAQASHGLATTLTYIADQIITSIAGIRYRQRGRAHYSLDWQVLTDTTDLLLQTLNTFLGIATGSGVSFECIEGPSTLTFRFDTSNAGFDGGLLARRTDVI